MFDFTERVSSKRLRVMSESSLLYNFSQLNSCLIYNDEAIKR